MSATLLLELNLPKKRQKHWLSLMMGRCLQALRATVLALAVLGSPVVCASEAPDTAAKRASYSWGRVAIGGGGFVTGLDQDDRGETLVARTDVYGAYVWDVEDDRWRQLVSIYSMPEGSRNQDAFAEGAYEIAVAPSMPDRMYMAIRGCIYRSDNRGKTWVGAGTDNPFPIVWDANSEFRLSGAFMAVSPQDPDLVLLGTPGDGLWRTETAGRHWQRIDSVPPATDRHPHAGVQAPGQLIWFAPGTRGTRLLVMSSGHGMYASDDAGKSFRRLAVAGKQPLSLRRGDFDRHGHFFGADDQGKTVWMLDGEQWIDVGARAGLDSRLYGTIASNPDRDQLILLDQGGAGYVSTDDGSSWVRLTHDVVIGQNEPPWLRVSNSPYFSTAQIRFDKRIKDRIWNAAGVGVFFADVSGDVRKLVWHSQTRGIEEIVANDIVQAPGQPVVLAGWDFGMHIKRDLRAFSETFAPAERALMTVHQVDWSPSDPLFLVSNASDARIGCCFEDGNAVMAGSSHDGGRTWTKFATLPSPSGVAPGDPWRMSFGTIAVSATDTRNIVWAPAFNRAPHFTTDGGKSWQPITLASGQADLFGSFEQFYYQRKTLVADKAAGAIFYLYHSGEGTNAALLGLWKTGDGGRTWNRVFDKEIAPASNMAAKLRAVPGRAGHLFFTAAFPHTTDTRLRRTTDGGASWQAIDGVTRVDDIAFGKSASPQAYPAIYISGRVSGLYGIWRSTDDAKTWLRLTDFAMGSLDQVTALGADPDHFGRVYIGYKGSGWVWGEPSSCIASNLPRQSIATCTTPDPAITAITAGH